MKGLLAGAIAIVILALLLPRSDDDPPPQQSAKGARAAALSTSGSFSRPKSSDGLPVFTASNVGPGALVEGAVTIVNAGRGTGYFSLSQKDVTDVPGPNGGALSQELRLEIRDVSNPSKPVPVYTGPFAGIGVRGLGFIREGAERDYRFTATLADTTAASPISGQDALKGSAASARFVWRAVDGAPPARPARPAPPRDRRPPRLHVSISNVQRLLTRASLETRVRCGEACTLTITGPRVRSVRRTLRAGRLTRARVAVTRPALRTLRRGLLAGRAVAVKLTFTARDGAGNRFVVRRTVRLNPRRR